MKVESKRDQKKAETKIEAFQERYFSFDWDAIKMEEGERGNTLELSVSSEEPFARWWGVEILGHKPDEIDLSRFNDGAMCLFNHDIDKYVGIILRSWIDGKKLKVNMRFDTHDFAQQIFNSVQGGNFKNVSVRYTINDMETVPADDDKEITVYRVTNWTPIEFSFVTIPADNTVGVGRNLLPLVVEEKKMTQTSEPENPNIQEAVSQAIAQERDRAYAINRLCAKHGFGQESADEYIQSGTDIHLVRAAILDKLAERQQEPIAQPVGPLGLSEKERGTYSIRKAIAYKAGFLDEEEVGLELEVHRAIQEKMKSRARGILIPTYDLAWNLKAQQEQRATYAVGAAETGGNVVETDLLSEDFIYQLRNRLVVRALGARILSGLEGIVDIPRQNAISSMVWVAEEGAITQSESTFDKITLTPHDAGVLSIMTRRMLLQNSIDIEAFIRDDLAQCLATGIDLACINGSGSSNQPTGILNYTGVNSIALGTNGADPTWANIVQMETEIAADNADSRTCCYLTNAKVRGKLKTTQKFASTSGEAIWQDYPMMMGYTGQSAMSQTAPFIDIQGMMNGYKAAVSNQVPGNLTKGTTNAAASAIILGDFSQLLIGHWGLLDVLVNPYGTGFDKGNVQIRAMQTMDVELRRPEYFCYIKDATT